MAGIMWDARRSDLRSNVLENPYWITSAEMDHADIEDQIAVPFSFPIGVAAVTNPSAVYGAGLVLLHEFIVEVTEAFAGGTPTFNIGQYTIATDDITTLGATSDVGTPVYYHATDGAADVTSIGIYYPDTSCSWLTAKAAATWGTNASIIPADSTVLCIGIAAASNTSLTAGKCFLHALISEVPLVS